ncbi:putative isoflavone 3'-hydroxylase [Helianthus anomalus]
MFNLRVRPVGAGESEGDSSLHTSSDSASCPCLFLRFGSRNVLHVASSTAAKECLSKNDVVFANRPHLLSGKYFGYNYTSMPWAPYGDHWQNLRRISVVEIQHSP